MAPRTCNKKRGNLRIDAALDAMRPFGFPPMMVRSTVKELLTVYGGDDGWIFIEEGSYTLLIDTLLEKQRDGEIDEHQEENERDEDHPETSEAGCSRAMNESTFSKPEAEATMKQSDGVLNFANETNGAFGATLPTYDSEARDHFWNTPAKANRRKPYHGWISNDDDRDDLVHLEPVPLPEEFANLLKSYGQRTRKRSWDVKPGDL